MDRAARARADEWGDRVSASDDRPESRSYRATLGGIEGAGVLRAHKAHTQPYIVSGDFVFPPEYDRSDAEWLLDARPLFEGVIELQRGGLLKVSTPVIVFVIREHGGRVNAQLLAVGDVGLPQDLKDEAG